MKGVVEIYGVTSDGNKDLLIKQDNLTTVGFSENIVDLLSTPSSVSIPSPENDHILDTSNFEIQAFSMSKNADHFRKNQHSYKTVNFLHNSDLKDTSGWLFSNCSAYTNVAPGPVPGSSGTLLDTASSAGNMYQVLYMNGNDGAFSEGFFSGTDVTFSVDMKFNFDNPPVQVSSNEGSYVGASQISLNSGKSKLIILWDDKGTPSLDVDNAAAISSQWQRGGLKSLGNKWYRFFVSDISAVNETTHLARVWPSIGNAGTSLVQDSYSPVDSSAGSVYISRPQLELGRVPTEYVETSSFQSPRDETLAFSLLNTTSSTTYGDVFNFNGTSLYRYNYFVASGSGGKSLSSVYGSDPEDKGVSAYIPTTSSITPYPHPNDRVLTEGARTPVEEALGIEFIKGQLPDTLPLSSTLQLSSYNKDWVFHPGYDSAIGRHVAYMGAMSPSVALPLATRAQINFVSALDFEGMKTPLSSQLLSPGMDFGEASDQYGYIELYQNGEPNLTTSVNKFPFRKNTLSDFSSTGEITYHMRYHNNITGDQRDTTLLNIFGGIDTLGLWGFDLKKMKEDNIDAHAPYPTIQMQSGTFSELLTESKRRYKLYNKIVLTDNLVKKEGKGSNPGIFAYDIIDVYWKVKFL